MEEVNSLVTKGMRHKKLAKFPQQLYLGIQDGYCNLRCPMCFLHSSDKKNDLTQFQGFMPIENLCNILDEVKEANTLINPYRFSEPLVNKDLRQYYTLIKEKGLPLLISTNGFLLTKEMAEFFVDIKMDSISFSIDAFTAETLYKVRRTKEITKIRDAVFMMLEARGNLTYPRIGVSFAVNSENEHERDQFVEYWLQYVDVVRVNGVFDENNHIENVEIPGKRVPCYALYSKMVIDFKGDVLFCITDAFATAKVGNVFEDGIEKVWNGEELSRIRHYHETGQFEKLPLCEKCNLWIDHEFEEKIVHNVSIRTSASVTYYNRLDRLESWTIK